MEGEPGHEMYIILRGSVLLYQIVGKRLQQGPDVTFGQAVREVATLREGDFFGEMALIDGRPRSTCAVALADLDCLVMDEANFAHVVSARSDFVLRLLRELSRRVRELEDQLKAFGQEVR
jgi:CRP-like cAMP-binding protein